MEQTERVYRLGEEECSPRRGTHRRWCGQGTRDEKGLGRGLQERERDCRDKKLFHENFKKIVEEEIRGEEQDQLHEGDEQLNAPMTKEEVKIIVQKLKNAKASGIDGVIGEFFKYGGETVLEATWRLFRRLFEEEKIPKDWSRGLIVPLPKEGDPRNTDNYRGITLLSVVGKLFASILTRRLQCWCEDRGKLVVEQAGFRPGRSTSEHVWTLNELISSRKERGQDTYCCFLDIRKEYFVMVYGKDSSILGSKGNGGE